MKSSYIAGDSMSEGRQFFFAGGGTGGHIYPAIAVAEQIIKLEPTANIHFFCSGRNIDSQILSKTKFKYSALPAVGFSARPDKAIAFCSGFLKSYFAAKKIIGEKGDGVITGVGGFVAAPVCLAGYMLKQPVALINVDIHAGKANKLIGKLAQEIFVQFEDTVADFAGCKAQVHAFGCPLRDGFNNPQPAKAIEQLGLNKNKKILLITGASSGSANINRAVCLLLDRLNAFTDSWQVVHLTGTNNYEQARTGYAGAKISHKVLAYYDDMPNLTSAADLVIGRSGAGGVAEYAAAGVPSICLPYPYHKDKHQYLNAGKLVAAGAAVIVDDVADDNQRAAMLGEKLERLMGDDALREQMAKSCRKVAKKDAAFKIAEQLLAIANSR
jgi:UDP-N-acetylglucosamine--N-acetylmuramyl-(pentapeptide) pyrophosphoryl-undecaprenol N-acetylglucosamine transferase